MRERLGQHLDTAQLEKAVRAASKALDEHRRARWAAEESSKNPSKGKGKGK